MAQFDFPSSPSTNQTYTANSITFKWDGVAWRRITSTGAQGNAGAQGAQGHQGAGGTPGAQGAANTGAQGATGTSGSRSYTVTNNGASNYVIDGASNPTLNLLRGFTYTFNMNAAGHGFGIQTSSGTWNSSNEYTTGITNPRAATGTITFAVPYNAPSTLYYACTSSHSGMVGTISISNVGPTGAQGAAGAQGNTGSGGSTGAQGCLLYTSPSPRDRQKSRMPSSA